MDNNKAMMMAAENALASVQSGLLDYLSEGVRRRHEFLDEVDIEHLGKLVQGFSLTQSELDYFYGEDPAFEELEEEE